MDKALVTTFIVLPPSPNEDEVENLVRHRDAGSGMSSSVRLYDLKTREPSIGVYEPVMRIRLWDLRVKRLDVYRFRLIKKLPSKNIASKAQKKIIWVCEHDLEAGFCRHACQNSVAFKLLSCGFLKFHGLSSFTSITSVACSGHVAWRL